MLSKESENADTTVWGERRTDAKQSAVDSWWKELYEPTENQLKWLQGEIPSTITDMRQQIKQLHIMLERRILSTKDLEGQGSLWYDISDKEGLEEEEEEEEEATEVTKEKHIYFPGVCGSQDFVAKDSISESHVSEKQGSFSGAERSAATTAHSATPGVSGENASRVKEHET